MLIRQVCVVYSFSRARFSLIAPYDEQHLNQSHKESPVKFVFNHAHNENPRDYYQPCNMHMRNAAD